MDACYSLPDLLRQVKAFNRAWKVCSARYGEDHPFTLAARDRKSATQVELLRRHPTQTHLVDDSETGTERLFSVRLRTPTRHGGHSHPVRDADHLPFRVLEAIVPPAELRSFLERGE